MRRNIETMVTHYRELNGDGRIEGLERRVRLTLLTNNEYIHFSEKFITYF